MRSGDLLVETKSAIQSKSYLSTKHFLDSFLTVTPHRSLNFSRGVISEPDLLTTPDAKFLMDFLTGCHSVFWMKLDKTSLQRAINFRWGCGSLVVKVADLWSACYGFESSTTENLPCKGGRCTLNMSRRKRLPVGEVWNLGDGGSAYTF
ncbi:hypothetical protein TNCV_3510391 [Trichonephila clavipes]|nr:hypothetical protein TNCV_3510391 [Trichonephila clavipes]